MTSEQREIHGVYLQSGDSQVVGELQPISRTAKDSSLAKQSNSFSSYHAVACDRSGHSGSCESLVQRESTHMSLVATWKWKPVVGERATSKPRRGE